MILLQGYQILKKVYEGNQSLVYSAVREFDRQRVIIKVLKKDYPTILELEEYEKEYSLIKSLQSERIIQVYDLQKYENSRALVLEDFGGKSLKFLLREKVFSISEILDIALKTVEGLQVIHHKNIIHKDLNSANITYNRDSKELKIIDFNIAVRVTKENYYQESSNILEGRLDYISPEQTGRIRANLDYRTDFYSLGITFYELLTNKLPFEAEDSLELIHSHISKSAIAPNRLSPDIPDILSDIVMKLIEKNPDNRYQSAWGLKFDLEKCLYQWQTKGFITPFKLGEKDISDKFAIPSKLYGRNKIVRDLLEQWNDFKEKNTVEMTLISGYSGSGKSSLVEDIFENINNQGYYISGKFDQVQKNIPYSAFISAFRKLVKNKLKESQQKLNNWKNRILEKIGKNGQIIIDVIPEIELIIGKQPPVQPLSPEEAQNRFNLVFQQFMDACVSKETPLILFLDDLQWADQATLKLMELMMNDSSLQHLFLVGAYRNNEVSPDSDLVITINKLKEHHHLIKEYYLDNLTIEYINQILVDTLKCDSDKIEELGQLIFQKTGGNPFFLRQFLHILYSKELISFDYENYGWQWDVQKISQQDITDNVIDLIINQYNYLPQVSKSLLKIASCIGNSFDVASLSLIKNEPYEIIYQRLQIAVNNGLILSISPGETPAKQEYKFLHDKVQQAVYSIIEEEKKSVLHLRIGRLFLKRYDKKQIEDRLFEIVGHLNIGRHLIKGKKNLETLIKLNLKVGKKAMEANAYYAAQIYLDIAWHLLNDDSWQNQYDLTLKVAIAKAELTYLSADFDTMEIIAQQVLDNAHSILEKVPVYKIIIGANATQRKTLDAIRMGKEALSMLGVDLPESPNPDVVGLELQKLGTQLEGIEVEDLINLPVMENAQAKAIMDLLAILFIPFFQGMPELMPFIASIMVGLSIGHGNTSTSALGYGVYGLVLSNFFGLVETGFRFGRLAIGVMDKYPDIQVRGVTLNLYAGCIHHHQAPSRQVLSLLRMNYDTSVVNKDLTTAGCILVYGFTSFFSGIELKVLERELPEFDQVLGEFKQFSAKIYIDIVWQTVQNLRLNPPEVDLLVGDAYDERVMIPKHIQELELTAIAQLHTYKLMLRYLVAKYEKARQSIGEVKPYLMTISGIMFFGVYHFYAALTYCALWDEGKNQSDNLLEEIEYHQNILETWANNAPMNYGAKWHLVEAEKQRLLGNKSSAIDNYDIAIDLAEQHNYINIRAIALELAGKFYLDWGKKKLAKEYLQESFYNYGLWGANAKIEQLEQKYPQFLSYANFDIERDSKPTVNDGNNSDDLDLATVMKASQAISGEIVLDNLLQTLMKILLENAGAQKGCLLLYQPNPSGEFGQFTIAIDSNGEIVTLYPHREIGESVPESIINYVARTQEYICLDNSDLTGDFLNDTYIKTVHPSSIICYPLINQGKLLGVVYLENNITSGACQIGTRLEILQLLSGQAAIALTNAQLYKEGKQQEKLLQQFLEAIPVGIGVLDKEGKPYYANKTAQQILGKGVVSGITKNQISNIYNTYVVGTDQPYPNDKLAIVRALKGEISTNDDVEIRNGEKRIPIESWGAPIYGEGDEIQFAMIAFQDITKRKKADQILKEYNAILEAEVKQRTIALEEANKQLSRLVNVDGLTQIPNRRCFDEYLEKEWQRHLRKQYSISLLLIDIDYFKLYNDEYGHQQGDNCLIQVAQAIQKTLHRPGDLAARYGGEEFVVVLPETSPQGALVVGQTISKAVTSLQIVHQESLVSDYVSLSIGTATMIPDGISNQETLISRADNALYQAKERGRNTVIQF
ncbi:diguanylate cyclase with PAS/PAC and GAF sensors [Cyanobacterium stanieri PCC 7202]|uniref:Diguanylate cyclase with PAS/PAC and GAF sensors n=1 Tax=Cyanobacterium stanieri (strain ATCC 29140 / PCC 7202) TaxID=292563 RepID=K9YNU5_CYASC|nr:diguanylate cyclase with PAS/PAC and GAF sensors [Cyanobacterium stanieri PCC 7202]